MTVDERFEQLERKTKRLEQRNKRLTVAMTAATLGRSISGRQLPLPEEHL